MIAATPRLSQFDPGCADWRRALADAIRDPLELCAQLELDPAQLSLAEAASRAFPLLAPRKFVARMRRGDPRDPLLLQVLPQRAEDLETEGFSVDPVGDRASCHGAGVLRKYHGRALLIATGACAIHCRYCFRRSFPYAENLAAQQGWASALTAVREDTSLSEVILSGGDPLTLSDRRLEQLSTALQDVAHIQRLRIHTRMPVVLPERVDTGLLGWLRSMPRLQVIMVLHVNHAREIDHGVAQACHALRATGATLLNQSVLLAGVNDSTDALAELSEALFAAGVLPYYLHLLDKVAGASHFDVPETRALGLHRELLARLPGYLVPRLVREIAGAASKTPVVVGGSNEPEWLPVP